MFTKNCHEQGKIQIKKPLPVEPRTEEKRETNKVTKFKQTSKNIKRWHESRQIRNQLRQTILDYLFYLTEEHYNKDELELRTTNVYQHIYSSYPWGGQFVCSS